jgi:hypothetical protein
MDTVNFQCGHCGKLMGVPPSLVGQRVRCPHCQQVVLAPVPPPAPAGPEPAPAGPPLETSFHVPPPADEDSIFTPPEESSEDLFGAGLAPRVEMPPELAWVPPPAPEPPPAAPDLTLPQAEPTVAYVTPPPPTPDLGAATQPAGGLPFGDAGQAPPPGEAAPGPAAEPAGEIAPEVVAEARRAAAVRPRSGGGGWIYPILIIPLISYSIFATIALAMVYLRPPPPDPLEFLPDPTETPATRLKHQPLNVQDRPLLKLPPHLRTPLGQPIQVGDVRVKPTRVEFGKVVFHSPGRDDTPSRFPTLSLHLEVENVSEDVAFRPMDRFFNRLWNKDRQQFLTNMPFSYLEMGPSRLYGGPCKWEPRGKEHELVETVVGQDYGRELKPGETFTTFVCVDPDSQDPARLAAHPEDDIARYQGPLTYRVHLRRGLVKHRGRDVSVTTVIGVDFDSKDIQKTDQATSR